jgi:hypothetical protein
MNQFTGNTDVDIEIFKLFKFKDLKAIILVITIGII